MPRNPSIINFFRYAKLSENAGYGIDKMMKWKELTGKEVSFESELTHSNHLSSTQAPPKHLPSRKFYKDYEK